MLIIIDGYNFIFTVPALERHVGTNRIEPVREHIISLFSRYKEVKRYDVIVVFDGNYTQAALPKKQTYSGIIVMYSRSGISADTEIKNLTSLCQNPGDVHIVTYDNEIKRHVRKCGCHIIEPIAMYREIMETLAPGEKNISDEPEDKRKGPSKEDAKYWKDVFKDLTDDELKSCEKKTDMPKIKRQKTSSPGREEPSCKYQRPSAGETQYWVRIFKDIGNE